MPDDYYVSKYSGEEIDERLTAAHNAVRYDAAQTLTDAQKTQARRNIGSAPDGGGVMESAKEVAASSASESYDTFCAKLDAVLATMPSFSVKFLRVYPPQYYGEGTDMCALFKSSNDYASVYTIGSYNVGRQGFRMVKRKLHSGDPAGQWDPLEYINPEMLLGVEYRTTERYQRKPVYAKRIHFESMPSGAGYIDILPSDTEVPNALISTAIVIRCYGRASVGATIPFYTSSSDFIQVGVLENSKIRIYTAKAYGGTADITVHYVKSTD